MTEETYYQKNREKQLALAKTYQDAHRDYYKAYNKIYYQKNKDKIRVRQKENKQITRQKNPKKSHAKKQEPPPPTPTLSVVETMALPPIIIQTGSITVSFD